jgi:hypothetical protein
MRLWKDLRTVRLLGALLCVAAVQAAASSIRPREMKVEEADFQKAFEADPIGAGRALDLFNASVCKTNPSKQLRDAISMRAIELSSAGHEAITHAQSMMLIRISAVERAHHCAWSARKIENALSLLPPTVSNGQD